MRSLKPAVRYVVMLLTNAVPLMLTLLFYRVGGMFDLMTFLPCLFLLSWINYRYTGTIGFLLIQSGYALFTLTAGYLSTILYTRNISNDGMSYAVGYLITIFEFLAILAVTVIGLVSKLLSRMKKRGNPNN